MNKFGIIKSKILKKLTDSYGEQNKSEMKKILNIIKEDKNFKDMYLLYEDIENKHIEDKEIAELYVNHVDSVLKGKFNEISETCKKLEKMLSDVKCDVDPIYESIDQLAESDKLYNIEKKVYAKKFLLEHLRKKKQVESNESVVFTENENLLYAVMANNFNSLYENSLNEEEKNELKDLLSLSFDDLKKQTEQLSEEVLNKITTLLNENQEIGLTEKLQTVRDEVLSMKPNKFNLYKLKQLKGDLI